MRAGAAGAVPVNPAQPVPVSNVNTMGWVGPQLNDDGTPVLDDDGNTVPGEPQQLPVDVIACLLLTDVRALLQTLVQRTDDLERRLSPFNGGRRRR